VTDLTCFKAYNVRGEIGVNIDDDVAYRIGRAVAQHFSAKSVVIGFDARETSPAFAAAVAARGGVAIQSKTGHAFIKQTMRKYGAVYGGEMSAHHYFRDFAFCDSGMIPWLLVAELVSHSGRSLADLVSERFGAFPSSGEINFRVEDAGPAIERVLDAHRGDAVSLDETDGVSLAFADWRFNLRRSNTEPLVRLNVEGRGGAEGLSKKISKISNLLGGTVA
jgi:phosphomannomutase